MFRLCKRLRSILEISMTSEVNKVYKDNSIDPMHKWWQFKYYFVYIQISPTSLILGNIFF